jgi:hypothetical protein
VQLTEALCYKPEDRGFDSLWCLWDFLLTYFQSQYGPRVYLASNSKEYLGPSMGVKVAGTCSWGLCHGFEPIVWKSAPVLKIIPDFSLILCEWCYYSCLITRWQPYAYMKKVHEIWDVFHLIPKFCSEHLPVGRDSDIGIATRYKLYSPGILVWWRQDFPHPCRPALGHTQLPVQWVRCHFWVQSGRGVELATFLYTASILNKE